MRAHLVVCNAIAFLAEEEGSEEEEPIGEEGGGGENEEEEDEFVEEGFGEEEEIEEGESKVQPPLLEALKEKVEEFVENIAQLFESVWSSIIEAFI